MKILCDNNNSVSIYSAYFPPRFSIKCDKYENLFKRLGNKFIVGGDFNAKHIWWRSRLNNPKGKKLYKCLVRNNYMALSTGTPTYWPSDPLKIPDLLDFFVYSGISPSFLDISGSVDLGSDHTPILLNYKTVPCKDSTNNHLLTHTTDVRSFQDCINQDTVEAFVQLIHEAAYRSTPHKDEHRKTNIRVSLEIRNFIKIK